MKERLQKILSACGIASRRQAEKIIAAGRVTCNGFVCKIGDCADPDVDRILLDGEPISPPQDHLYLMLNKPRGYVTTLSDEKGRPDVSQLVSNCGQRVYPVGRLDMDSEGLLVLTNDGDFSNHLMHPSHETKKVYKVTVQGYSVHGLGKLKQPVVLDGYQIRPPEVKLLWSEGEKAGILITIHEGRNRQVRRMCAIAGMSVRRLIRIAEGSLKLGDLQSGKWRMLTKEEIAELMK